MRKTALTSLLACALAACALVRTASAEAGDGLEGTVWKYRPKGVIQWLLFWNRDYLVFQSGNFMKAALKDEGYAPALYSAEKTGEGVKWSSSLDGSGGGSMSWNGLRVSYWMTGTFKRGGSETRWKAWQIFPKPPKMKAKG